MSSKFRSITGAIPLALIAALCVVAAAAQDTFNAPRGQQIPPPACFTIRGAWEGGYTPCTAASHSEWLADITHWRMERLIRVGYGPFQLGHLAEGAVDEIPARLWREKLGIGRKKRADRDD